MRTFSESINRKNKYLMHFEFRKLIDDALKVVILSSVPLAIVCMFALEYPTWFSGIDYGMSVGLLLYFICLQPRIVRGKSKAGFRYTYKNNWSAIILLLGYAIGTLPRFCLNFGYNVIGIYEHFAITEFSYSQLLNNEYFLNITERVFSIYFLLGLLLIALLIYHLFYHSSEITEKEYTAALRLKYHESGCRLTEEGCYVRFVAESAHKERNKSMTYDPIVPISDIQPSVFQESESNQANGTENTVSIKLEGRKNRVKNERTSS